MNTRQFVKAVTRTILKIVIAVAVIILVYNKAMDGYEYGYRIFAEAPMTDAEQEGRTVAVTITEGMSAEEMGHVLYENGLIRDEELFSVQFLLSDYRNDIKPGTYELSTSMRVEEMLEKMARSTQEDEA